MDLITEIRRRHFVSGETISSIVRSLNLSRPTVRKHLKTETEPVYERQRQLFWVRFFDEAIWTGKIVDVGQLE